MKDIVPSCIVKNQQSQNNYLVTVTSYIERENVQGNRVSKRIINYKLSFNETKIVILKEQRVDGS